MKLLRLIVLVSSIGLFSVQSFGFFNPITDITDRILVVHERIGDSWVEVDIDGGIDVAFFEWLQAQVQELDANTPDNCSSNYYVSEPVSVEDAMLWNHDIAMSRPFPWGGVFGAGFGTASGAALGLLCEGAFVGSAEGACVVTLVGLFGAAGASLGSLIDRYRERSDFRPPLTCGDRLMAIETICTGWIDGPHLGPREVRSSSVGFTSLPGPC